MAKLVTIYGGSGFLGRQIARMMAREGWRVRVAVRRPNEALFVRTYGAVGQVDPVPCNVRDDLSVRAAMAGADAVINCVGILVREGRNTFETIHEDAAGRIARIAAETGVAHLVHVSAIGADAGSDSRYAASKGRGEAAVLQHRPDAMILRPSVIFGPDDNFFNKLAGMSRLGPVMFVPGGQTEIQPVFVEDVARAAAMGAEGRASGIYELGGPEVMTMRDIARLVLRVTGRRRALLNMPHWMARFMGGALDVVQVVSGGLLTNRVITRDQARTLRHANVVAQGARGFADLGIDPVAAESVLPSYLWRFRDSGQFAEITASAQNLRETP